jgi:di/tricarboxylate transporter
MVAVALTTFGKYQRDHPSAKLLVRLLPIMIGIAAGIAENAWFGLPQWMGALSGFAYPYWMIPAATKLRREYAKFLSHNYS